MATLPTAEECAMRILRELYIAKNMRPGESLLPNYFNGLMERNWRHDDLNMGLNYCLEQGWLTTNKWDAWVLTEEGFKIA